MNTKSKRITAAKQTLQYFEEGGYELGGVSVDLSKLHQHTLEETTLYTPEMTDQISLADKTRCPGAVYHLSSLPVVSAFATLHASSQNSIGILNFASAKNPGGGFLNGALAQEESLALCSNMYLAQLTKREYYDANRACNTMLYTDHMIYSRDVVFIREDAETLWETPLMASVLTAPAVNMGQYLLKGNTDVAYAEKVMKDRMRKVLRVFAAQNNEVLVLGAYGCGVFRNDPEVVARMFVELLKEEGYEQYFKEILFAVYDSSKKKGVFHAFQRILTPYLTVGE